MIHDQLKTFYDVQQLLKQFGFIIYFKNEEDRFEMMEQELKHLYQFELITKEEYLRSKLLISQRRMKKL